MPTYKKGSTRLHQKKISRKKYVSARKALFSHQRRLKTRGGKVKKRVVQSRKRLNGRRVLSKRKSRYWKNGKSRRGGSGPNILLNNTKNWEDDLLNKRLKKIRDSYEQLQQQLQQQQQQPQLQQQQPQLQQQQPQLQ